MAMVNTQHPGLHPTRGSHGANTTCRRRLPLHMIACAAWAPLPFEQLETTLPLPLQAWTWKETLGELTACLRSSSEGPSLWTLSHPQSFVTCAWPFSSALPLDGHTLHEAGPMQTLDRYAALQSTLRCAVLHCAPRWTIAWEAGVDRSRVELEIVDEPPAQGRRLAGAPTTPQSSTQGRGLLQQAPASPLAILIQVGDASLGVPGWCAAGAEGLCI